MADLYIVKKSDAIIAVFATEKAAQARAAETGGTVSPYIIVEEVPA